LKTSGLSLTRLIGVFGLFLVGLTLCGCLEQYQTTRIPSGSLSNFLLHLQAGELDDARSYFAPGLVTPSANLDQSLQDASRRLQRYDIRKKKYQQEDLGNGQIRETVSGQARPTTPVGQPTPAPEQGWQDTDILTARMVVRGPGWRILDFDLTCCPEPK
jgi:hypothetical protein